MSSLTKQKKQILRLTQVLQNTYQQVQNYKKRQLQTKNFNEKLLIKIDKLQEENRGLQHDRDQYRHLNHNEELNNANKLKQQYDLLVIVNKAKSYTDKVNQTIKQIVDELKQKLKYDLEEHSLQNIQNLQRQFAKASMGVLKYQQQFIKISSGKEILQLQIDKLRRENTCLYEMTAKLQENFVESDKVVKRFTNEIKRMKQREYEYEQQVNKMKYEIDGYIEELKRYENMGMGMGGMHDKGYDSNYNKLKQTIEHLENQIEQLRDQNNQLKQMSHSYNQNEQATVALKIQVQSLKQQVNNKTIIIQKLQKQLNVERQANRVSQNDSVSDYKYQIQQKDMQISSLQLQVLKQQQQKQKIITVYQNESSEHSDKIIRQQQKMQQKQKHHKNRIQQINRNNKNMIKQISNLQRQIQDKYKQLEQFKIIIASKDKQIMDVVQELESKEELLRGMQVDVAGKQTKLRQLQSELSNKNGLIDKLECEVEKHKLINSINNENIQSNEQKDKQIKSLNEQLQTLITKSKLSQEQLNQQLRQCEQQLASLRDYTLKYKSKEQDNEQQIRMLQQRLNQRDNTIVELQQQLLDINKDLNEVGQCWGIDDNKVIIDNIYDKIKKQGLIIMELTVKKQKVINQGRTNQLVYSAQKQSIRKQFQNLFDYNIKIIDQLDRIYEFHKNNLSPKHINIPETPTTEQELEEKWGKLIAQIQSQQQMFIRDKESINELETAWYEKQSKMAQLLLKGKDQVKRLRQQNQQIRQYVKLKQVQNIEANKQINEVNMKLSILEAIQQEQQQKQQQQQRELEEDQKQQNLCESLVSQVKNISQLFRSKQSSQGSQIQLNNLLKNPIQQSQHDLLQQGYDRLVNVKTDNQIFESKIEQIQDLKNELMVENKIRGQLEVKLRQAQQKYQQLYGKQIDKQELIQEKQKEILLLKGRVEERQRQIEVVRQQQQRIRNELCVKNAQLYTAKANLEMFHKQSAKVQDINQEITQKFRQKLFGQIVLVTSQSQTQTQATVQKHQLLPKSSIANQQLAQLTQKQVVSNNLQEEAEQELISTQEQLQKTKSQLFIVKQQLLKVQEALQGKQSFIAGLEQSSFSKDSIGISTISKYQNELMAAKEHIVGIQIREQVSYFDSLTDSNANSEINQQDSSSIPTVIQSDGKQKILKTKTISDRSESFADESMAFEREDSICYFPKQVDMKKRNRTELINISMVESQQLSNIRSMDRVDSIISLNDSRVQVDVVDECSLVSPQLSQIKEQDSIVEIQIRSPKVSRIHKQQMSLQQQQYEIGIQKLNGQIQRLHNERNYEKGKILLLAEKVIEMKEEHKILKCMVADQGNQYVGWLSQYLGLAKLM